MVVWVWMLFEFLPTASSCVGACGNTPGDGVRSSEQFGACCQAGLWNEPPLTSVLCVMSGFFTGSCRSNVMYYQSLTRGKPAGPLLLDLHLPKFHWAFHYNDKDEQIH